MYNNEVANTGYRKINRCGNVAGNTGGSCWCHHNNNVAGNTGRRCEFVYECLLELLEDAVGERNRLNCDWVYACLLELLEEVLGEGGTNNNCRCRCRCNRD